MRTLQSDNADVRKMVAERSTSHPFKLITYPSKPKIDGVGTLSRLFQFALLLKRKEFWSELKRGERARVQTEMVEFIALPFPFSSKLKIWSFHVVVMQGRQRNVQKSVMHVQSCCFAH